MTIEVAELVTWIVVGLAAGWLASSIMRSRRGLVGNLLLGLIGAFVGGVVFSLFGLGGATNILGSILIATSGAIIILAVVGHQVTSVTATAIALLMQPRA